jgi:hypothetical protein
MLLPSDKPPKSATAVCIPAAALKQENFYALQKEDSNVAVDA